MSVLEQLANIIPPPNYLRFPCAGVDISDTSLKYIQFEKVGRKNFPLSLKQWGDIDIEEGAIMRGEIKDPKKLSDALKEVRKKTGLEHVRVSLPEERAYLFETDIKKGTPYKEIRNLLEFRLEENVPLSPRDAYFDYHVFDMPEDSSLRVSVTVYSRETINNYYEVCRAANMTPLSFEVEAQAIARASITPGERGSHMIVDFGKTRTGVGIVSEGILMYTSTIDIGGKEMSASLRSVLGDTPEAALTELKNTVGLVGGQEDAAASQAILATVESIKDELAVRLQYWNNLRGLGDDRHIRSIILCGGSANLRGLPEYLTTELGIPSQRSNVWHNVMDIATDVPPITKRYSYGYATTIGLALAPFI